MIAKQTSTPEPKPWTGRHFFWAIFLFFGVMLTVNIVFIVIAVRTFTGEDVPRSYQQGVEYNQTIAARRSQAELGWKVRMNDYAQTDSKSGGKRVIIVKVEDGEGRSISNLEISALLRHPTDKHNDQALTFSNEGDGRYKLVTDLPPGGWKLQGEAVLGAGPPFLFEQEIWVN